MLDDNLNHRAGAEVTAIEANAGTAELCEHIACLNQAAGSIQVIHKDARHLQLGTDLAQPHDILVFEVFDCGLLGEGALHILAAVRAEGLLTNSAAIVPCKAKVLCQLIDLNPLPGGTSACNLGTDPAGEGIPASGVDARSWDAFQWSPDYQGFDLAPLEHTPDADGYFTCQAGRWKPMSEPAEAMHFDFTKVPAQHTTPEQRRLCLPCTSSGCINAIAFWFELQLDNEVTCTAQGARKLIKGDLAQMDPQSTGATSSSKPPAAPAAPAETETETAATAVGGFSQNVLCTGPLNCQPGSRTWQVAVQQLGAAVRHVQAGNLVAVLASHDTYSMSFELLQVLDSTVSFESSAHCSIQQPGHTHTSGSNPVWLAQHAALKALSAHVGRAGAQDPLAFRRLARTALSMAARPHDFNVEPSQAAALAAKFCS